LAPRTVVDFVAVECLQVQQASTSLNNIAYLIEKQVVESTHALRRHWNCLGRRGSGVQIAPPRPKTLKNLEDSGSDSAAIAGLDASKQLSYADQKLPHPFPRGLDVRVSGILWCADAPNGS
jgi:hypothetical protein